MIELTCLTGDSEAIKIQGCQHWELRIVWTNMQILYVFPLHLPQCWRDCGRGKLTPELRFCFLFSFSE